MHQSCRAAGWPPLPVVGSLLPRLSTESARAADHSSRRTPPAEAGADQGGMTARHACLLCEYSRPAEHSTVLDPVCPRCGGMLEHTPARPRPLRAGAPARLDALRRSALADRAVVALVVLPLVLAAGKTGWSAAGAAGGAGAAALALLVAYVALAPPTRAG